MMHTWTSWPTTEDSPQTAVCVCVCVCVCVRERVNILKCLESVATDVTLSQRLS